MTHLPQTLTIATSDSGGGAGIQADIKAIQANGAFALSVLVAVTAQNTKTVTMIHPLPREIIEAQIDAVFDDFKIGALKTGMLFSADIVRTVSNRLRSLKVRNLVVDPVMIAKSGAVLLKPDAIERIRLELIPLASIVTPNIPEAECLAEMPISKIEDVREAARRIHRLGCRRVLIKGGHLPAAPALDMLYDGMRFTPIPGEYIKKKIVHGTGCAYSAAIAAQLSRGRKPIEAIRTAKAYVTEVIRRSLSIGHGHSPAHHFYFLPPDPIPLPSRRKSSRKR